MDHCCEDKKEELSFLAQSHRSLLLWVLGINFTMFVLESVFGILAHSTSLVADSLDMLGDSVIYAMSLYAIGKSETWNAGISFTKGIIMSALGLGVIVQVIYRFQTPGLPQYETMGWVGSLAFVANMVCAVLLFRHRGDNINMRSTWLCSRNDALSNVSVLVAGALVALLSSRWPDLVVGIGISSLVVYSGVSVMRESAVKLRNP